MPVTTEPQIERIASLIQAEFKEMPGMRLTEAQVRRLWHLSGEECDAALECLVDRGDLVRDQCGCYRGRGVPH